MQETKNLGDYLGYPVIDFRVTKETFRSVLPQTTDQLSKWKANTLSQAGRSILIQANLASKASF